MNNPIHVLKTDGGVVSPSTTLCGVTGRKWANALDVYVTPAGRFRAVLPSDPFQGPTCSKCRQVALVMAGQARIVRNK